jgi:hypothetical protein
MKAKMKAPGTNLLTLKYYEPLSNFAFNFNLRPSTKRAARTAKLLMESYTLEYEGALLDLTALHGRATQVQPRSAV